MSRADVDEAVARESVPQVSTLVLWFALAAGIVSWLVHLGLGSAIVPALCEHDLAWVIDALTVGTGLVCVAAALVSWRIMRRFAGTADPRSEGYRLLGLIALASNLGSLALIVGEGLMHGWIGVCR